ncbi:MAG: hypothetical protein WCV90_00935 [Candidatus Woesearchaeota archaeon]|jgi:hypothetical protein
MNSDVATEKSRGNLELVLAGGLAIEDMYVTDLAYRINHHELPPPEPGSLEDYFVFNSGNLFNGYGYALTANYILTKTIDRIYDLSVKRLGEESWLSRSIDYLRQDQNRINVASGVISSLAIGFFETTGIRNVPDLKDIPAGVVGALLHTGLRYLYLRKFRRSQASLEYSVDGSII